jgi:hypothetical protein
LKVNYRTSEQIRQYAQRMLRGLDIDDLVGGAASIAGDHSIFKGPEPVVTRCRDTHSEAEAVMAWVRNLIQGRELKPHKICVTPYKPLIVQILNIAGIQTHELKDREDPGEKVPGVRQSMKRLKGWSFVYRDGVWVSTAARHRPDVAALSFASLRCCHCPEAYLASAYGRMRPPWPAAVKAATAG